MKFLTRSIWLLSVISLLNDIASDMLYPVIPIYLKSIGYSIFIIGLIEGIAEAMAGLSKGYFGNLSDTTGKRVPFVRFGYLLSAIAKPLIGVFTNVWLVLSAKTMDKLGKGIRTGARDAILSSESSPENKGKVFGFHRAMDTTGAVIGPVLALIYLYYFPGRYRDLFLIAIIPGVLAIFITLLLKEKVSKPSNKKKQSFFSFVKYIKHGPVNFRRLLVPLLLFTLVNSSDVFLLLKVKESGVSDTVLIGMYIFYNLIYAVTAFPIGALADKVGLKNMLGVGILIFSLVYFLFNLANGMLAYLILFTLYGVYAAATEGIAKALIVNICPEEESATAIGTYSAFQSICTLFASAAAGFIWYQFGSGIMFAITGFVSAGVGGWLLVNYKLKIKN